MAEPTTDKRTPTPAANPPFRDLETADDGSVSLSMNALRQVAAAVSLVLAWQNRTQRGRVLPAAIEHGLLTADDVKASELRYSADAFPGLSAEEHAARVEKVNALHAVLASVAPTVGSGG